MQTMEKTLRPVKVVFQGSPPPIFKRQRSKPEYLDAQVKGEDGNSSEGDPMADQGPEADLDQTEIQAKEPPLKSKRFVKHRQKHLKVKYQVIPIYSNNYESIHNCKRFSSLKSPACE